MTLPSYSNPATYWEQRLSELFDLRGVGYSLLGTRYNTRLYRARREALERALAKVDAELAGKRVLEVGCGTGFYTRFFAEHRVESYVGLDLTAVSVERLKSQYPGWRFVQADIGGDDVPITETFDVVLVADVLFHIVDAARFSRAIQHMSRSLRPGGLLILSDVLAGETVQVADHVRVRSFEEYRSTLASCELEICGMEPIFSVLHPPTHMPSASLAWRLYALSWRFGFGRIARHAWFDASVPPALDFVDRSYALRHADASTPNSKWLLARKRSV